MRITLWPFLFGFFWMGCAPEDLPPEEFDAGPWVEPAPPDVPDNEYCEPVDALGEAMALLEEELLERVNEVRAAGGTCGVQGTFPPTHPLEMDPALRCAARVHTLDMSERNYFSHESPNGVGPGVRITKAGFASGPIGENIALGSTTVEGVMGQWMNSDGHCANILNASYYFFGAGVFDSDSFGYIWTQTFGGNL